MSSDANMHFWLLFLVEMISYGTSRISEHDLKAVNFAKPIEGRKLNGSLIKEVEVDSEESCQVRCVAEEKCKSYNFGTKKNKTVRFICQLSDSDRFVGHANFTKDNCFKYRGVQVTFQEKLNGN